MSQRYAVTPQQHVIMPEQRNGHVSMSHCRKVTSQRMVVRRSRRSTSRAVTSQARETYAVVLPASARVVAVGHDVGLVLLSQIVPPPRLLTVDLCRRLRVICASLSSSSPSSAFVTVGM
eukprot:527037-Rhodomonas_salina.2